MNEYFIMCKSMTNAQRCRKALENALISAAVTKAPRVLTAAGCGYAVRVNKRIDEAVRILRSNGILTGKVYSAGIGGKYSEVNV